MPSTTDIASFNRLQNPVFRAYDASAKVADALDKKPPAGQVLTTDADGTVSFKPNAAVPQVTSGHGPPAFTPTTSTHIYFDEDTGAQFNFWGGVWH